MKRVVVTGMGIVSSIGNNTQEVLASLAGGDVRHRPRRPLRRTRLPLPGSRRARYRRRVDGRPARHALPRRRHGVEPRRHGSGDPRRRSRGRRHLQRAHRHHHGLGRSLDAHDRRGGDATREKGPKRVGPFAVPKAMSSTASATLATWFKIKGVNYSISSACATSNHCIGNAYEMIQLGKQDIIFAGGCEDLDWTLSVLFDAMGAMSTHFNDRPEVASRAYDNGPRRLRHRRRRRRARPRGARARQGARRAHLRRDRRLRRDLRRLRHGAAVGRRRRALHAHGARPDRRPQDRLHQPARHLDAGSATWPEIEAIREVFGTRHARRFRRPSR